MKFKMSKSNSRHSLWWGVGIDVVRRLRLEIREYEIRDDKGAINITCFSGERGNILMTNVSVTISIGKYEHLTPLLR